METRVEKIPVNGGYVEKATIIFEGKEFTASGAAEWTDKNGKHCFGLYVDTDKGTLTTWSGDRKFSCQLSRPWKSNFGDKRRTVYMSHEGKNYSGILYTEDWNQYVKLTERKGK